MHSSFQGMNTQGNAGVKGSLQGFFNRNVILQYSGKKVSKLNMIDVLLIVTYQDIKFVLRF